MNCYDLFLEKKLPDFLSNQDLLYYFEQMKSGNCEARKIIIEHNIKFVIYVVLRYYSKMPYEKNELVSVGILGLIKSVDTFDVEKNIPFLKYASKCINNEILMYNRREKKHLQVLSFENSVEMDMDGRELKIADVIVDDSHDFVEEYEKKESMAIINKLLFSLSEKEKNIVFLYFGLNRERNYTQTEIAKMFNVSQSNVSFVIRKALQKLKENLKGYDIIVDNCKLTLNKN